MVLNQCFALVTPRNDSLVHFSGKLNRFLHCLEVKNLRMTRLLFIKFNITTYQQLYDTRNYTNTTILNLFMVYGQSLFAVNY